MRASKIILMVLVLCFASCAINAQYLREQKLKQDISVSQDSVQKLSPKTPLMAGTLSFIVPGYGLGQYYNGEVNKFFVHSLISAGLTLGFISLRGKFSDINIFGNIFSSERSLSAGSIAFLLVYTTNWVWSIVDAVVSANNINKQIKLQKYRSDVMDKLNFGITVNKNKQLNLKFAFDL